MSPNVPDVLRRRKHNTVSLQFAGCVPRNSVYVPRIMFEKIKVQLPAAGEKVAHLRRFL